MGARRHWLTFETPETVLDSDGAQLTEWVPAFSLNHRMPCEVVAMTSAGRASGSEFVAADAFQSRVMTKIVTQYRSGFNASMRARLGSTIYNIEAVLPDPESRNRYVTLLASSGVNEG